MKPVVDRLANEYSGTIEFIIYPDTGADPRIGELANAHGINAVPTMVLVTPDGTEVDRIVGSLPEAEFRDRLEAARAAR